MTTEQKSLQKKHIETARRRCPSCRNEGDHEVTESFLEDYGVVFLKCQRCRSEFSDPIPTTDYTSHTATMAAQGFYIEHDAGVQIFARNLFKALAGRTGLRVLDVGCGMGFGISFLKEMLDCHVIGLEPSTYGQVGAQALDLNILPDYLNDDFVKKNGLFDAVHCSEVIEHVEKPEEFMGILASALAPGGVLVLTTPDPERAPDRGPGEFMAIYTPGRHVVLISRSELHRYAEGAGLCDIDIGESGSSHLLTARKPGDQSRERNVTDASFESLFRDYLERIFDRTDDRRLKIGMAYRGFTHGVNSGNLEYAERFVEFVEELLNDTGLTITGYKSIDDVYEYYPIPTAILCYSYAMYRLNKYYDLEMALKYFEKAYRLSEDFVRACPVGCGAHRGIIQPALFHVAYVAKAANKDHIREAFKQLLLSQDQLAEMWLNRLSEISN